MKIPKLTKYQTAIVLGLLVVLALAFLDIKSAYSGVFGTFCDYTNGNYTAGWWGLFRVIAILLFLIVPVAYYFLVKKDKSEAIAIFLSSYIAWMFGLADIFYFWLQGLQMPATLPWLAANPVIGRLASFTGGVVTPVTVYLSVALSFVVIFYATKYLEKIN
jgi:hypothetical protein